MATPETSSTASPSGPGRPLDMTELLERQNDYLALRHNVAMGMLIVAPALIALPPRKLDIYTAGLAFTWVFCLNEVTKHHFNGAGILRVIVGKREGELEEQQRKEKELTTGWRGEDVHATAKFFKEREEEGLGIGEIIKESVWDVWQQRGSRKITPEEEADEELPLKERVLKYEKEIREKKEREAVDELTKST
ncbi:hypothetical protein BZA05DRAFT_410587 [Tricharina praecox]|uniref:uncharacterized protein n=1 Tax=Tricharina praecox TaxID=43433 RepID=UPI002220D1BD|nr:uncharacterized protein BZA05DRAFT_410587 [Tricharina praecox]KAI5843762.1 hypothetical protein BZA05DRAFT_410587 [Tricharina praecox]